MLCIYASDVVMVQDVVVVAHPEEQAMKAMLLLLAVHGCTMQDEAVLTFAGFHVGCWPVLLMLCVCS